MPIAFTAEERTVLTGQLLESARRFVKEQSAQGHGRTTDGQRRHFQRSVLPVLSVQGTPVLCAAAPDAYRIVRPGHGVAGTAQGHARTAADLRHSGRLPCAG